MVKMVRVDFEEGDGLDKVEYHGVVKLKKLSFSEKNSLEEEATTIKFFGQTPQVTVSTAKMKELAILKSAIETDLMRTIYVAEQGKDPRAVSTGYALDINGIRSLPQEVGELLFAEFADLNTLSDKKKGS